MKLWTKIDMVRQLNSKANLYFSMEGRQPYTARMVVENFTETHYNTDQPGWEDFGVDVEEELLIDDSSLESIASAFGTFVKRHYATLDGKVESDGTSESIELCLASWTGSETRGLYSIESAAMSPTIMKMKFREQIYTGDRPGCAQWTDIDRGSGGMGVAKELSVEQIFGLFGNFVRSVQKAESNQFNGPSPSRTKPRPKPRAKRRAKHR